MKFYNIMHKLFFTFSFFFLGFLYQINAQQSENSPYSRFGVGELADNNFNPVSYTHLLQKNLMLSKAKSLKQKFSFQLLLENQVIQVLKYL